MNNKEQNKDDAYIPDTWRSLIILQSISVYKRALGTRQAYKQTKKQGKKTLNEKEQTKKDAYLPDTSISLIILQSMSG